MHIAFHVNGEKRCGRPGATGNTVTHKRLSADTWDKSSWSSESLFLFNHIVPPADVLDATLNILRMIFKPSTLDKCGMDVSL